MTDSLQDRRRIIHNTFTTHDGKLCLEMLIADFQTCKLYDESTSKMAYRVGQFELVQYLKEMTEHSNE